MLSPGDRVKDYEIIAPLRSGGMAMLYLARRRGVGGFSRLVALKLVHPQLLGDEAVKQLLLDEARLTANVAHPNVISVEEVGQTSGSYFIAMQYVHGSSLAELLARLASRKLRASPKVCVWLAAQIAEGLHAVHEARSETGAPLNIVHRDVSPQNVLIGHTGHVKLIDLGIANTQDEENTGATRRTVLGKLGYMAPEQLRLEPADRRSDVYALGVMIWEMLTSRSLFRCRSIDDDRDWATRERPTPPSQYASTVEALDQVVLKAIAFDPHDRYENALELRTALLRAMPEATQVDAPMVAVLMHTMLGDELERQRASFPSEVSVQLALDDEQPTTSEHFSFDELTADMITSGTSRLMDGKREGVREPTLADSPAAIRRDPSRKMPALSVLPPLPHPLAPLGHAEPSMIVNATPCESEILTEPGVPLTLAPLPERTASWRPRWVVPATTLSALCLTLGMVLGASVSDAVEDGSEPPRIRVVHVPPVQVVEARMDGDDQPRGARSERAAREEHDQHEERTSAWQQTLADGGRIALTSGLMESDDRHGARARRSRRDSGAATSKRATSSKSTSLRSSSSSSSKTSRSHSRRH